MAGFWETNEKHFVDAGVSVLVLVAAWLLYWLLRYGINRFSRRHNLGEADPGAETRLRMIQRLSTVALFFVAIGLVFWIMDVSALKRVAVGMFASAGVVGIALGFAAQTTMANLVSGIIIAFAQPIRLGDNVKIDGEYGAVESIGLFYTYIRTWDNRRLVIPNKLLSDQTIRNYTIGRSAHAGSGGPAAGLRRRRGGGAGCSARGGPGASACSWPILSLRCRWSTPTRWASRCD